MHYCYHYYYYTSYIFFLLYILSSSHASSGQLNIAAASSNYDCLNQRCGNVSVTYPFTILSACPSFKQFESDANFTLNCTEDVLYLGATTFPLPVLSILDDSLIIDLRDFKSTFLRNGVCNETYDYGTPYNISFDYGGPYVSAVDNRFGSFGCSIGLLLTRQSEDASAYNIGGCEPFCNLDVLSDFSKVNKSSYECGANFNCCISNFPGPARVTYYYIFNDIASDKDLTLCSSYGVPFHPNYTDFQNNTYGFRIQWALPEPHVLSQLKSMNPSASTFDVADLPGNISSACSPRSSSRIIISDEVPGYRCSCLPGYHGDGYAHGRGCVDRNECTTATTNSCVAGRAECRNTQGSYTCHCKSRWHVGDGMTNGTGCQISPALIKAVTVTGGVMGLLLLLLSILGANILVHRRRKQQYFERNGGLELQAFIAAHGTGRQTTRFFTAQELREATQNFSEHLKLGTGGFGTVYRGTLKDKRLVAVKKANQPGDADKNQFLNELAILTQINHRHIVRLYGCCLETANPLLVYELVSNGDLAENLTSAATMGWVKRLQVATQVADALAYLHAAASPPILHRDVKTANILLDDNLDAKVADFGISRLIPEGEKCVSTVVQGTLGYLDPEYFQTLKLTDKSDVYGLGVVLVELITGLKPVDNHTRDVQFANLALLFLNKMREERVYELLDARLDVVDGDVEAKWRLHSSIHDVARLAQRCLALRGEERPSMSELALMLHQLNSGFQRPAQALLAEDQSEELQRPLFSTFAKDADSS